MVASASRIRFDRKKAAVEIKRLHKRGAEPHQIGAVLLDAMKHLGRSEFWPWVTKDCGLTRRDARRYMVDRWSEAYLIAAPCSVCGQQMEFRPSDNGYRTALWQCVGCGRFEVAALIKPQEPAVAARASAQA